MEGNSELSQVTRSRTCPRPMACSRGAENSIARKVLGASRRTARAAKPMAAMEMCPDFSLIRGGRDSPEGLDNKSVPEREIKSRTDLSGTIVSFQDRIG